VTLQASILSQMLYLALIFLHWKTSLQIFSWNKSILGCFTNAMNTAPTGTKHICATRIANCLARAVKVALKVSNNSFCHVAQTTNHVTHRVEHFKFTSAVQAIIIVITQFTIIHLILGC
jgi:hypothetical protein